MDTKKLEHIGETYIINTLLDADILVAKPFFDLLGADLLGFTSIDDKARFCRIQCKYRELKTRTSAFVDTSYVIGAFVLFLYIKTSKGRNVFCFLPKEIEHYFRIGNHKHKKVFRMTITPNFLADLNREDDIKFNSTKVTEILNLMKTSSPDFEIRCLLRNIIKTSKEIKNLRGERDKLRKLIDEIKVLDIERKALGEKKAILEKFVKYMESQVRVQQ